MREQSPDLHRGWSRNGVKTRTGGKERSNSACWEPNASTSCAVTCARRRDAHAVAVMNTDYLNYIIMDLAEEDSYGLWEFLWQTEAAPEDRPAVARLLSAAVMGLVAIGMVDIVLTDGRGKLEVISPELAARLLSDFTNWTTAVANSVHVEVVATELGKRAWDAGQFGTAEDFPSTRPT